MKKTVVILFFIVGFLLLINNSSKNVLTGTIRYRILANSNSKEDQEFKLKVNKDIIPILSDISKSSVSLEESRSNIKSNIPRIENTIEKYTSDFNVNFGENYFPKKVYNDVVYDEGYYESLVITLGDGLGDNWWCILFPPLCLIEANKDNLDNITYTTYIEKIINNFS